MRPGIVFGADLIAGFPTESEAMFGNSLRLIEDCGLTYLHVFPYSARKGTPAAKMPQLPLALRKERAARLRAAGDEALTAFLESQVGETASVLIEKRETDGRSPDTANASRRCCWKTARSAPSSRSAMTGRKGLRLTGRPARPRPSPPAA